MKAVIKNNPLDSFDWSLTSWEGSRREQMHRWAQLTLEQIILAQEEMVELSERLAQSPEKNPGTDFPR
ncbi:MAG: hypothetical protein ACKVP2_15075 [Burkholderiales bacterium]